MCVMTELNGVSRIWRTAFAICFVSLLLASCAPLSRKPTPPPEDTLAVPVGFSSAVRTLPETGQGFQTHSAIILSQVRATAGARPLNMLALSGGGAGGGFGVGALVGWTREGTRPEFQIVTGVSAGALIAPFAYLGSTWDPELVRAFSDPRMQHLLRWRWSGALFGASAYSGRPLADLVDTCITDELIRAVASESAKGRLLLVATTDLDRQRTVVWDLGLIARQGGEPARRLFRDVLIAASSIPGALPPVMIPVEQSGKVFEEMHADGATIASLLVAPGVAEFLTQQLDGLQGANLYVIVNGQLGAAARTTPMRTFAIAKRGIEAATLSNVRAEIAIADAFARRNGMVIRITRIPDDYPFRGPLDLERSRMQALFNYAVGCSSHGELWSTPLEAMEPSERTSSSASATVTCPGPIAGPALQSVHALEDRRSAPVLQP